MLQKPNQNKPNTHKIIMATKTKNHSNIRRQNFNHFLQSTDTNSVNESSLFEFDESELYNSARSISTSNSPEFRKSVIASRFQTTSSSTGVLVGDPMSLPVNVPDWSKILGEENRQNRRRNYDVDSDEDGDEDKVPPHEFLARTRIASFSVHEGVGRTLKGRDLSRVRNAIWAKTGFQD
ncbi:protein S40-4-like [Vicia villosa]|uniref:protein S40-4-like n=1 Tax=Vicia villosa TaxID=3911 RepID=UPI00273AE7E3|nr:protein S40-4-like [Vicia villosa]XP_058773975.1 protein S40-4-like [Vicia villosa]